MIPYSKQHIFKNDIKVVNKTLKSKYLTQGPVLKKFEKKLKNYVGCTYSLGFNSATSALHSACFSIGLSKKDSVWTSPISFVASANCARYFNAKIDFVDIDLDTFNISVEKLEKKLLKTKKSKLPKILIVVHLAGNPVDMKSIKKLSDKYKFKIIEDASHALGSSIGKKKVGSCHYSDITVFSFHPVKTITSAEGGMMTTKNKIFYEKSILFREHGIVRNKRKFITTKNILPTHYEQHVLGFNYRLSEIHSALGISQLGNIKKIIRKRMENTSFYKKKLINNNLKFQKVEKNNISANHLTIIRVNSKIRNKLFRNFLDNKVNVNLHYIPIYKHPYYKKFGYKLKNFINSEKYFREAMSIPNFYSLNKKQMEKVLNIIKKYT